jgi:hypothetical protein
MLFYKKSSTIGYFYPIYTLSYLLIASKSNPKGCFLYTNSCKITPKAQTSAFYLFFLLKKKEYNDILKKTMKNNKKCTNKNKIKKTIKNTLNKKKNIPYLYI